MSAPEPSAMPSPLRIFDTLNAFQRTRALEAAIQLDLFTAVGEAGEAGAGAEAVAARCGTAPRGARILCDFLAVVGLLSKEGDAYRLAPDAAVFLDRRSPAYLGGALRFLLSPLLTRHFDFLADAARQGGTALAQGSTAPEHPMWVEFAEGMAALQIMPSEMLARLLGASAAPGLKVLDLAAGHGLFGIALARHNPATEVYALDWPNVLEVARRNAREAGVESRFRTIPGDAFTADYGSDFDLVLLTNFLHHFDPAANETLLGRVHAALKPGGRAVALEFVPNEDRVSPPEAARFSLVMLATTPAGDAYTFSEYQRMFRNAGFGSSELHPLPPTFQQVIIATR
jgi:ubiquinone/menaquinone biosynthesis C-methylase UbiE